MRLSRPVSTVLAIGALTVCCAGWVRAAENGLVGSYFDNKDFTNRKLVRVDSMVDFNWRSGSPAPEIGADTFSVRWEGQVETLEGGTYAFYTTSDDGVRLWVNNQLLIDNWTNHAPTENTGTIALEANQRYDIKLEMYENSGGAVISLKWQPPGLAKAVIPTEQLHQPVWYVDPPAVIGTVPANGGLIDALNPSVSVTFSKPMDQTSVEAAFSMGNLGGTFSWAADTVTFRPVPPLEESASFTVQIGDGARDLTGQAMAPYVFTVQTGAIPGVVGEYFNEMDLTSRAVVRIDPNINFAWGSGSPDPLIEAETFSVRWTGLVQPAYSKRYTFTASIDNGVRVWVANQLIIDDWRDIPPHEVSGSIDLQADQWYSIVVEHFENWGGASIKLYWQCEGQARQIVPPSALRIPPDTQVPSTPTSVVASLVSDRTVILTWPASTDDTIVGRYDVYRDGRFIGWTCEPTYRDTNLTPVTEYTYRVQASDVVGKRSGLSDPLAVKTTVMPEPGDGKGLLAKLYNEMDFSLSSRTVVRVDEQVAFDWGNSAPAPEVEADTFSIRWEGKIQPFYSEVYKFYIVSDDGIRLWVNGQIVVDHWSDHGATEKSGQIPLKAGELYDIRVDYYENTGKAQAKLFWESPSQPKELVPKSQLYPALWLGGTEIKLLTSVESAANPIWMEGNCSEDAASIQFNVTGDEMVDAVRENPTQWYADTASAEGLPYGIALDADNPTAVSLTVSDNVTSKTYDYSLVWTPTKLNDKSWSHDEIVIRVNDSLLFTAEDAGPDKGKGNKNGIVKIDCDGDGKVDYHGAPDVKVPWKYTAPGYYTVTLWVRGKEYGTLTVTVMDVDLHGPTACEIGYARSKFVEVFPKDSAEQVSFTSVDESLLGVSVIGPVVDDGVDGVMLSLGVVVQGEPVLQARVGSPTGPLVRQRRVDPFSTTNTARDVLITKPDDGGGTEGVAVLTMYPLVTYPEAPEKNPWVVFRFLSPGASFDGGATEFVASTADFERNPDGSGSFTVNVHLAEGETNFCLYTEFYQIGSTPQKISFPQYNNGEWVRFAPEDAIFPDEGMTERNDQLINVLVDTSVPFETRTFTLDLVSPERSYAIGIVAVPATPKPESINGTYALSILYSLKEGGRIDLRRAHIEAGLYNLIVSYHDKKRVIFQKAVMVARADFTPDPLLMVIKELGQPEMAAMVKITPPEAVEYLRFEERPSPQYPIQVGVYPLEPTNAIQKLEVTGTGKPAINSIVAVLKKDSKGVCGEMVVKQIKAKLSPDPVSVYVNGSARATATIEPVECARDVSFSEAAGKDFIDVLPTSASMTPQAVMVYGKGKSGKTELLATTGGNVLDKITVLVTNGIPDDVRISPNRPIVYVNDKGNQLLTVKMSTTVPGGIDGEPSGYRLVLYHASLFDARYTLSTEIGPRFDMPSGPRFKELKWGTNSFTLSSGNKPGRYRVFAGLHQKGLVELGDVLVVDRRQVEIVRLSGVSKEAPPVPAVLKSGHVHHSFTDAEKNSVILFQTQPDPIYVLFADSEGTFAKVGLCQFPNGDSCVFLSYVTHDQQRFLTGVEHINRARDPEPNGKYRWIRYQFDVATWRWKVSYHEYRLPPYLIDKEKKEVAPDTSVGQIGEVIEKTHPPTLVEEMPDLPDSWDDLR